MILLISYYSSDICFYQYIYGSYLSIRILWVVISLLIIMIVSRGSIYQIDSRLFLT